MDLSIPFSGDKLYKLIKRWGTNRMKKKEEALILED